MRTIGTQVKTPKKQCEDSRCPFHGSLSVRGRLLEGTVVTDKMRSTVTVRRDYVHYISKYLRSERRHSSIPAHNPPCIDAKVGDHVKLIECRPLSKVVSFVVIEKLGGE